MTLDDAEDQLLQPASNALVVQSEDRDENLPLSVVMLDQAEQLDEVDLEMLGSLIPDATVVEAGGSENRNMRRRGPILRRSEAFNSVCGRQIILKVVFLSLLLGSVMAAIYIYMYSWYVLLFHGLREKCDVPLAPWMLAYLFLAPLYVFSSFWRPWVNRFFCGWSPEAADQLPPLRVKLLSWLFTFAGYYVLFSEMDLVKHAKTCPKTAPSLYSWAAYLAPQGVIHFFLLGVLMSCSFTALIVVTRVSINRLRPADPGVIRQLATVPVEELEDCQCSICLEGYTENHRAKMMPCCRNVFHKACLKRWLKQHRTCPLCREDLHDAVTAHM